MRKTIALDIDGTIAKYDGWKGILHFGDPIEGSIEFVNALNKFADILIYSTRSNSQMNNASPQYLRGLMQGWLDRNGFIYKDIWIGQGKPPCAAIVDDRGVSCVPQKDRNAYPDALEKCKKLCGDKE